MKTLITLSILVASDDACMGSVQNPRERSLMANANRVANVPGGATLVIGTHIKRA